MLDPENAVVKLCAEGMAAEQSGDHAAARSRFQQAWSSATDDFEASIAAHYLARHQPNDSLALHWNTVALERARNSGHPDAAGFYPSLLLNLGFALENMGESGRARLHYLEGIGRMDDLPAGSYADMVRQGLENALERTKPVD